MNRIILIGNGFDLAHGLKTDYKSFIDDFWKTQEEKILAITNLRIWHHYDDDFITIKSEHKLQNSHSFAPQRMELPFDLRHLIVEIEKRPATTDITLIIKNKFLEYITHKSLSSWVDVETEYHNFLCDTAFNQNKDVSDESKRIPLEYRYESIEDLNNDFGKVRQLLQKYLTKIVNETEIEPIGNIKKIIDNEFDLRDFTSKGQDYIIHNIYTEISLDHLVGGTPKGLKRDFNHIYALKKRNMETPSDRKLQRIDVYETKIKKRIKEAIIYQPQNNEYIKHQDSSTLFLNFNYICLEKMYMNEDEEVIHIHGELNNEKNPMIFGYGDEIGDEYKRLERLDDNHSLENIKSIKYLETNNYNRLLSFIESDQYQIFILGHSCGNSDRTLLNTLFEHENCASIKFYYRQYEEDEIIKDNYSDVIRNISRNFNDKRAMREKVVNKEYCDALVPYEEGKASLTPLKI